jgi:spore germination protein GerM
VSVTLADQLLDKRAVRDGAQQVYKRRTLRGSMRRAMRVVLIVTVLGGGLLARSLARTYDSPSLARLWSWTRPQVASLYFSNGRFLVPVSRRLPAGDDAPRASLAALLDGPSQQNGLRSPIPGGVRVRSLQVTDGHARIDLTSSGERLDETAVTAVVDTMTSLPVVDTVSLAENGRVVASRVKRVPLLYFSSAQGLVAVANPAGTPRDTITAYLAGPREPALHGLPPDVRLLTFRETGARGGVSLEFTYTNSLRTLAVERPDTMRQVLLGMIATLTDLPSIRTVTLDFEGHARLGLGQCSDLLGVPQPRPRMLNDERLLVAERGGELSILGR